MDQWIHPGSGLVWGSFDVGFLDRDGRLRFIHGGMKGCGLILVLLSCFMSRFLVPPISRRMVTRARACRRSVLFRPMESAQK